MTITLKESLMNLSKETIIKLYLSAKAKADIYDKLKEVIDDIIKEEI
jgi:hypothetical protein